MLFASLAWTLLVFLGFAVLVPNDPAVEYVILDYIADAVVIWLLGLVVTAALVLWRERRRRRAS